MPRAQGVNRLLKPPPLDYQAVYRLTNSHIMAREALKLSTKLVEETKASVVVLSVRKKSA